MRQSLLTALALVCVATNGCSCRESHRRVPSTPFARPLEARFSESSRQPVISGREFSVSGQLQMDDPEAPIGGLTVKLIKRGAGGDEVMYWGAIAAIERQEGDQFRFECKMKAPTEAGEFLLRALYRRDKVAESKITVLPSPAADSRS